MREVGRAKARGAGRAGRRVLAPAAQGCPRCSGGWPCGVTRCAHVVSSAQTVRRKFEVRSALRAPASPPARLGCAHACPLDPPPAPSPRRWLTAENVDCGEGGAVSRTRRARCTHASCHEACHRFKHTRITQPDARVARPIVTRSGRWWRGGGDVCGAERGWFGLGARSALRSAPSMGAFLWVQVPPRAGHSERSELQLREGDRAWGGSSKRKPRVEVHEPHSRWRQAGRAGYELRSSCGQGEAT
jgi:hypothetical protein